MNLLGELAALATSVTLTFASTFLTLSARQLGSVVLNRFRSVVAIGLLGITHWVLYGIPFPIHSEPERWLWLGLSGIVGYVIGDLSLYKAFIWIGTRLSMLVMSLVPVIAAFLAWVFLGETISLLQMGGMALTLSGVAWVVLDRGPSKAKRDKDYRRGILYALGGAMGQAGGMVLSKKGLGGDFSPIAANLIRLTIGAGLLWGIHPAERSEVNN